MKDETLEKANHLQHEIGQIQYQIENIERHQLSTFKNPLIKELAIKELTEKLKPLKDEYEQL